MLQMAVLSVLYKDVVVQHKCAFNSYKKLYEDKNITDLPDFSKLVYPMKYRDIVKWGKEDEISVNVYTIKGNNTANPPHSPPPNPPQTPDPLTLLDIETPLSIDPPSSIEMEINPSPKKQKQTATQDSGKGKRSDRVNIPYLIRNR